MTRQGAEGITLNALFPISMIQKDKLFQQFSREFNLRHQKDVPNFHDIVIMLTKVLRAHSKSSIRFKVHMKMIINATRTLQKTWRDYRWRRNQVLQEMMKKWEKAGITLPQMDEKTRRNSSKSKSFMTATVCKRLSRRFSEKRELDSLCEYTIQMECVTELYISRQHQHLIACRKWMTEEDHLRNVRHKEQGDWLFYADSEDTLRGALKNAFDSVIGSRMGASVSAPLFNSTLTVDDCIKLSHRYQTLHQFYNAERVLYTLGALDARRRLSLKEQIAMVSDKSRPRIPLHKLPKLTFYSRRVLLAERADMVETIMEEGRLLWTTNLDVYYAAALSKDGAGAGKLHKAVLSEELSPVTPEEQVPYMTLKSSFRIAKSGDPSPVVRFNFAEDTDDRRVEGGSMFSDDRPQTAQTEGSSAGDLDEGDLERFFQNLHPDEDLTQPHDPPKYMTREDLAEYTNQFMTDTISSVDLRPLKGASEPERCNTQQQQCELPVYSHQLSVVSPFQSVSALPSPTRAKKSHRQKKQEKLQHRMEVRKKAELEKRIHDILKHPNQTLSSEDKIREKPKEEECAVERSIEQSTSQRIAVIDASVNYAASEALSKISRISRTAIQNAAGSPLASPRRTPTSLSPLRNSPRNGGSRETDSPNSLLRDLQEIDHSQSTASPASLTSRSRRRRKRPTDSYETTRRTNSVEENSPSPAGEGDCRTSESPPIRSRLLSRWNIYPTVKTSHPVSLPLSGNALRQPIPKNVGYRKWYPKSYNFSFGSPKKASIPSRKDFIKKLERDIEGELSQPESPSRRKVALKVNNAACDVSELMASTVKGLSTK